MNEYKKDHPSYPMVLIYPERLGTNGIKRHGKIHPGYKVKMTFATRFKSCLRIIKSFKKMNMDDVSKRLFPFIFMLFVALYSLILIVIH